MKSPYQNLEDVKILAKGAHDYTNHKYNELPYWYHLQEVYFIARDNIRSYLNPFKDLSQNDFELVIFQASWLHDIIEDCRYTYNDVNNFAGPEVAEIVYAVTNEKGKNRAERGNDKYYEGIRRTPGAQYIKICDRIANMEFSKKSESKMYDMYLKELPIFLQKVDPLQEYKYLTDKLC